jgi:hypothetical protein
VVVAVPGLGRLTLNLAALMSVILASGGAMWVFSNQLRMLPFLWESSKAMVSFLGVTLRARWVTLRARWVTLRARWVTLRARWVTLRARWVTLRGCLGDV